MKIFKLFYILLFVFYSNILFSQQPKISLINFYMCKGSIGDSENIPLEGGDWWGGGTPWKYPNNTFLGETTILLPKPIKELSQIETLLEKGKSIWETNSKGLQEVQDSLIEVIKGM